MVTPFSKQNFTRLSGKQVKVQRCYESGRARGRKSVGDAQNPSAKTKRNYLVPAFKTVYDKGDLVRNDCLYYKRTWSKTMHWVTLTRYWDIVEKLQNQVRKV